MIPFRKPEVKEVHVCEELITPMRAGELLKNMMKNRGLRGYKVSDYKRAMVEGRWKANGETIKLLSSGELIDGQHRLHAVIAYGAAVKMLVAYNLSEDAKATVDTGMMRRAGDVLAMDGIQNANIVAGAVRVVRAIEAGSARSNIHLLADEVRDWVNDHPAVRASAKVAYKTRKIMQPSCGAGLHYCFSLKDQAAADKFFEDLGSGVGLAATDGVLLLRERLLRNKGEKLKLQVSEIMALSIRAWNARRGGHEVRMLKGTVLGDDGKTIFPDIV